MNQSVAGKVAVVTGASSGIGLATARLLAAEGAKLALVARSGDKLETIARELGPECRAFPADLRQPAGVDRTMADAIGHFAQIDILIANAGAYIPGDIVDGEPDRWDEMISLNVNSVFRAARAALRHMIGRRSGDIIVTSSVSGHQAIQWEPVYSATKHAVQSFVHGVRRQAAPHGVRVGAVAPGIVLNSLWGEMDDTEVERRVAAHAGLRNEDVAEAMLFMLTRPPHVTIRDLVILPQNQDI